MRRFLTRLLAIAAFAGLAGQSTAVAQVTWGDEVNIAYNCDPLRQPLGYAGQTPCRNKIVEYISNPNNLVIVFFFYYFTDQTIFNALKSVLNRPADERPIVIIFGDERVIDAQDSRRNNATSRNYYQLTQAQGNAGSAIGFKLAGLQYTGNMHNKVLVTLRKERAGGQNYFVGTYATGSYNYTNNAAYYSWENFIFLETRSPDTMKKLLASLPGVTVTGSQNRLSSVIWAGQLFNNATITGCNANQLLDIVNVAETSIIGTIDAVTQCSTLITADQ